MNCNCGLVQKIESGGGLTHMNTRGVVLQIWVWTFLSPSFLPRKPPPY